MIVQSPVKDGQKSNNKSKNIGIINKNKKNI